MEKYKRDTSETWEEQADEFVNSVLFHITLTVVRELVKYHSQCINIP